MAVSKRVKIIICVVLVVVIGAVGVVLATKNLRWYAVRIGFLPGFIEQKKPHKAIAAIERTFVIDFPEGITDTRAAISRSHDGWTHPILRFSVESRLLENTLELLPDVDLKPYIHNPGYDTFISDKHVPSENSPSWWWPRPIEDARNGSFKLDWREIDESGSCKIYVVKTSETMTTIYMWISFHGSLKW